MLARRWQPIYPLGLLGTEMERLFSDVWNRWGETTGGVSFPAMNVGEDENNVYVEAEAPGLTMADLEIGTMGNELTVRGTRKTPEGEGLTYHRRERGAGEFVRVLRLPVAVQADEAQAALRNGVLTITLPKAAEAKPRKIEVKAK
jgi:HSP20 family protein